MNKRFYVMNTSLNTKHMNITIYEYYITISLIHGSIPLITSIHHHIINSWFYTTICLTDAYTACNIIIPNHTACYTPVTVIAEYCFLARIMHI